MKKPTKTTKKVIKAWAVIKTKDGKVWNAGLVRDIDYCECGTAQQSADGFYITKTKRDALENSVYKLQAAKVVKVVITYSLDK